MSGSTRRDFFRVSAGATIGCALSAGASLSAIEPIRRNDQAQFKLSLAAYSYRELLKGKNASLSLADFIDDCARFHIEGTELTSYYFPDSVTPQFLHELKHQCFRLGLDISGTAVGNDFGYPAGEERTKQIEQVKKWVDYAEILGAPVIRVFAGHAKQPVSEAEGYKLMVAGLEECCAYAGEHGVFLALENHGGPTVSAEGLLSFVRDINSPWFGVNLDTGNFRSNDVYREIAQVAPYAINVQVKVVVSSADNKKIPSDFRRIAQILRDSKYRGYVVLEYEEAGNPREECSKYLAQLREAFA